MSLKILNYFFYLTHVIFILFALFGWKILKLRKLHLSFMVLIAFSWFFLGFWFGFGYCFWTDWHWEIRSELGLTSPSSFIKLLVDQISGRSIDESLIDIGSLIGYVISFAIAVWLQLQSSGRRRNDESRNG